MDVGSKEIKKAGKNHYVIITAALLLILTWAFPRILLNTLGMDNPWTSYLYLYGFGGVFFLVGIFIILKSGACQLGRGNDTFWFKVLLFGYFFYAAMHALWIVAALYIPVKGAL